MVAHCRITYFTTGTRLAFKMPGECYKIYRPCTHVYSNQMNITNVTETSLSSTTFPCNTLPCIKKRLKSMAYASVLHNRYRLKRLVFSSAMPAVRRSGRIITMSAVQLIFTSWNLSLSCLSVKSSSLSWLYSQMLCLSSFCQTLVWSLPFTHIGIAVCIVSFEKLVFQ